MKVFMMRFKGTVLIILAASVAAVQLTLYDHAIISSGAGFTDEVANDTTVFSPLIDNLILVLFLALLLVGSYFALAKLKRRWLRLSLSIIITFIAYISYFLIEVGIQQHLSGFSGV